MVNMASIFPSKYLSAEDIAGQEYTVTITHITMETFDDGKSKAILHFQELPKGLTLNKTNGKMIASLYGPETDGWSGQKVTLFVIWTEYQGQQTQGIRVRAPAFQPAQRQPGQMQPQANTNTGYQAQIHSPQRPLNPQTLPPGAQPFAPPALDDEVPFAPEFRG